MYGWMIGRVGEWMDGWMDGWVNRALRSDLTWLRAARKPGLPPIPSGQFKNLRRNRPSSVSLVWGLESRMCIKALLTLGLIVRVPATPKFRLQWCLSARLAATAGSTKQVYTQLTMVGSSFYKACKQSLQGSKANQTAAPTSLSLYPAGAVQISELLYTLLCTGATVSYTSYLLWLEMACCLCTACG